MAWTGASASTWLREGWIPSALVWLEQSWASKLAAKACMAAWLSEAVHRDLYNGGPALSDLRFADYMLNFGTAYHMVRTWTNMLNCGTAYHMVRTWTNLWKAWRPSAYT